MFCHSCSFVAYKRASVCHWLGTIFKTDENTKRYYFSFSCVSFSSLSLTHTHTLSHFTTLSLSLSLSLSPSIPPLSLFYFFLPPYFYSYFSDSSTVIFIVLLLFILPMKPCCFFRGRHNCSWCKLLLAIVKIEIFSILTYPTRPCWFVGLFRS